MSTSQFVLVRIVVVVAVTVTLVGCPGSGGDSDDLGTSQSTTSNGVEERPITEPPITEPPITEPPIAEPPIAEPLIAEPPITEPPITEPLIAEPLITEPLIAEPLIAEPPIAEPPIAEPSIAEPPIAEPVEPNPPVQTDSNPLRNETEDITAGDPSTAHAETPAHEPEEDKFDPIEENGPIFVGWPDRAKLALVITGRQHGYIEPCGCAGLDRMKGGMSRRHTLFKQLREKGWPVVGLDVGGIAKGYGRQAVLKFHRMVDGMQKMGFEAIGLGTTDLQLPTGELAADAASVEGQPSPFLSANAALFGFAAEMTAKTRIIEAGGLKLGITSVLGKQAQRQLQGNDSIELADPETALAEVVPKLKQEADYLILLAHATMQESLELAQKFPEFDLVITAGGAPTPPATPAKVPGSETLLIEVGEKGMDAIVLAMFDDPLHPIRYQRVPLDSRFPPSPEMRTLMTIYQDQLQREWLSRFAVAKIPHAQAELLGKFVGSRECKSCHELSYNVWKKSGHAKAYDTLAELDPPRIYDPECISCHVIGWHPHEYYPFQSGFATAEQTPKLIDVGCENCHGPGGAHVAAEQTADLELQQRLQKALVITKEESQKRQCRTCHDLDNSPEFDFEQYWPKIEHYEDE